MQPIDWIQVGMVALGMGVGALIGCHLRRSRAPTSQSIVAHPGQRAALLALVAFLGGAVAEDLLNRFGRVEPGGAFLTKYILAAATGIGQYVHLRRSDRVQASRTRLVQSPGRTGA